MTYKKINIYNSKIINFKKCNGDAGKKKSLDLFRTLSHDTKVNDLRLRQY